MGHFPVSPSPAPVWTSPQPFSPHTPVRASLQFLSLDEQTTFGFSGFQPSRRKESGHISHSLSSVSQQARRTSFHRLCRQKLAHSPPRIDSLAIDSETWHDPKL